MRNFLLLFLTSVLYFNTPVSAQSCVPTNINNSTITLSCGVTCTTLNFQVPHLKSTDDYAVNSVPYTSFPGTSGTEIASIYIDDKYSPLLPMSFPFCFYGQTYNNIVVGSNGIATFEAICAGASNAYTLTVGGAPQPLPYAGGAAPSGIGTTYYPRTAIMGAYHDIDPSASPLPTRRIEYNIFGTAPCRKLVISFTDIRMFGSSCQDSIATSQIVLYENTGMIDIYLKNKPICTSWPSGAGAGLAILGLQDDTRTKFAAAPGKNCTQWNESFTGYRFTPNGTISRYVSSELLNMSGTVLGTADTATTVAGLLDLSFPNVCPPTGNTQYVIRTTFTSCPAGTNMVSLDTITLANNNTLPFTATSSPSTCGSSTGTITVTVTAGVPPYQYSADGGPLQSSNVLTGLAAGTHSVITVDAAGCTDTISVTVTSISSLPGTITSTGTTCAGLNNGTITVTPTAGAAPYSYSLDGGAPQASNIFTNVTAGSHTVIFTDANSCSGTLTTSVTAGTAITSTAVTVAVSCTGANNGSITITPTSGTGPYTYSIDGGASQPTGVFPNLVSGSHTVTITDATGCTGTKTVTVGSGSGITSTQTNTFASCPGVNNGTITITPTNGTAPYTYSNGAGPFQPSNIFTGLAPGTYTINIRDNNGCTGTKTVTIISGTVIAGTSSSTNVSCPGANNGTITAIPVTGTAPYTYTLDGGPSQPSPVFTGVAPGSHNLILTDFNGCAATVPVTITAGPGITGTASATGTSCPGVNNGTITVTPTSGAAPYSYSLDGGTAQPSNIFTNVPAGSHTMTFTDAGGCSATATATVTAGAGITGTASSTSTSCPGVNNGTASVTSVSSAGPYSYSIDGGASQPGNTFPGLAAGTHTLGFTDGSGCTGTVSVTVAAGAAITGTASATSTSCSGVNNGTATVTSVSSAGPYTYSVDGGASQPGNTFSGLSAGPHTLGFTDGSGCTGTVSVTVTAGAGITGTASSTATSCPGINNGTATVTSVSGPAPYTYSIDGGATQPGNTFPGLTAGTHTIGFTDGNGCTGTVSVTVAAGAAITGTASSTATSCPGINNGTATVTSVSGPAPYTYSIDGGATQPGNTFPGLTAGTHTIDFTDGNGCTGSVSVTVAAGPSITGTASSTATSCPGINNGTATVTSVSGTAPYSYSIDGGASQPSATFSNLTSGAHTLGFTDANGCTGTVPVSVVQGAALTGTATSTNTSCPTVNNGTVTAVPSSGGAPYQYSIDAGVTFQPGATFSNLSPGTYTITIKDNAGCTGTVSATVAAGSNITSDIVAVNPLCANINDGTLTINPTTGTAPYQYSLNGGTLQPSNLYPNLAPGPYTIAISDALGCTGTNSVTLTTNSPLATTISMAMPLCNGNSNGSITLTPSGGVAPYQYSSNGGASYQTSAVITGLAAGTHTIRIKDNVGCTKDTTVTLSEPAALTASATSSIATCAGNDGVVTITAGGGTAPYQYSLNGTTFQSNNVITAPATGPYNNITVRDANSCTKITNTVITYTDNVVLDAGPDTTICAEQSIILQPVINPEVNAFSWTPVSSLDNPRIKNPTATPMDTTKYFVTATWGPCIHTDSLMVFVKRKPVADAGADVTICEHDSTIITGTATNLSGTVNFVWTPAAAGIRSDSSYTTVVVPPSTQVYTLTVNDNYGCNYAVTDDVTVTVRPPVPAFAGNDTIAIYGVPHQLTGSGGTQYIWSPSANLSSPFSPTPLATLTQNTQFTVIVTDIAGCIGYDTVFVQVYDGPTYYTPNAFTPNGDGLNDIFRPIPVGILKTDYFRVFNRYGQLVFETNEWLKGWDGTFKGKKQPLGVYVWVIKGTDKNGGNVEMKGTVMLIQ